MFIIELVLLCGFISVVTVSSQPPDSDLDKADKAQFDRHPAGSELSRRGFGTTVFHNYGGSP